MALIDSTPLNMIAGGDLTADVGKAGKIVNGRVVRCTVAGEAYHGVIGDGWAKPGFGAAGDAIDFFVEKRVRVKSGAAFTIDAYLSTAADGRFITATSGTARRLKALEAATAADQFVSAVFVEIEPAA